LPLVNNETGEYKGEKSLSLKNSGPRIGAPSGPASVSIFPKSAFGGVNALFGKLQKDTP
jgi:hypothetical protein